MSAKRFGTFEGVFTPTFLSILGVIMYLRLGWVVGSVGLSRALLIIVIANLISLSTCLSVSSITTNIRIGGGGAYSIISKSLGLEVGSAIGIPLYLSQAISVAFYVAGFTECWVSVFPGYNYLAVSLITWFFLLVVSYVSARLAFRLQYVVIVIILCSIVSFFLGSRTASAAVLFQPGVDPANFWKVFAVFFPAVTGILAGVTMSGELKDAQKSIPVGIISALAVTFVIYIIFAFRFAYAASPQDLVNNTFLIVQLSKWRFVVLGGIMGATISSALSMFVISPRTLLALSKHDVFPLSEHFMRLNKRSEPTTAILFTAFLALIALLAGNLNTMARFLTMFFLITYGVLNLSVFVEKLIGIASFRPSFNVPMIFPLLGGFGCFIAMFLISPFFSLAAILSIIIFYLIFLRRQLGRNWPDVRKGLFIFIAEQAMKVASRLPYHPKIWKPNLLIPVENPRNWPVINEFVRDIVFPSGRVDFFRIILPGETKDKKEGQAGTQESEEEQKINEDLNGLITKLTDEGLLASSMVVNADDFHCGVSSLVQALKTTVFAPNVLFIKLGLSDEKDAFIKQMIELSMVNNYGLTLFALHPQLGLNQKHDINLWLREGSPNMDLAILIALQLEKNWEGTLRLVQAVPDEEQKRKAIDYFTRLIKLLRLPRETEIHVLVGNFNDLISEAPPADINIFGMPKEIDMPDKRMIIEKINTTVLFLLDSKQESATA